MKKGRYILFIFLFFLFLATLTVIPTISGFAFWLLAAGWALLVVATVLRNM